VLALSPIPEEGAGCRFRIAQFIPYLEAHGFEVTLSPLFTTEFFRLVYKPGRHLQKAAAFVGLSLKRLDSLRDLQRFDLIFIYREIFPIGPAIIERLLAMSRHPPIVFDFDDAIFLPSVSEANRFISALKFPGKVASIVRHSDHVVVGNDYLAAYARRFNDAVTVIPTCVDTDRFLPRREMTGTRDSDVARDPVVGWIGSPTTVPYIRGLAGVLKRVAERLRFVLRLSGAGEAVDMPRVKVENPAWSLAGEIGLFNGCDVGIYPLLDDEWSKGKCGFKAIEFMACGVPVVASAVGVNREIIQDGVNGFLASSDDEFAGKLERLLADPALRRRFAEAGRRTIVERDSVHLHAPKLAGLLRRVADDHRALGRTQQ
jgi:glycosyltransferase involved in cell wall biosynthesis